MTYFNSTKVQFGGVRGVSLDCWCRISIPLRYNLESCGQDGVSFCSGYFNSTKVQFGDLIQDLLIDEFTNFNSTKVQFGVLALNSSYSARSYFNSTKVQFGGQWPISQPSPDRYFNSTKVQFGEQDNSTRMGNNPISIPLRYNLENPPCDGCETIAQISIPLRYNLEPWS